MGLGSKLIGFSHPKHSPVFIKLLNNLMGIPNTKYRIPYTKYRIPNNGIVYRIIVYCIVYQIFGIVYQISMMISWRMQALRKRIRKQAIFYSDPFLPKLKIFLSRFARFFCELSLQSSELEWFRASEGETGIDPGWISTESRGDLLNTTFGRLRQHYL